jgi:hypothetical protein
MLPLDAAPQAWLPSWCPLTDALLYIRTFCKARKSLKPAQSADSKKCWGAGVNGRKLASTYLSISLLCEGAREPVV